MADVLFISLLVVFLGHGFPSMRLLRRWLLQDVGSSPFFVFVSGCWQS